MRATALVLTFTLCCATARAETPVAEVSQLQLYSSFWQNLHHVLYASAWARREVTAGVARLAMPMPADAVVSLTGDEAAAWNAAVAYYDRHLASKDLLFDEGLTRIKIALAGADDDVSTVRCDADLRSTLLAAAPVYRRHWWAKHDAANRAWITLVSRQTRSVAVPIVERLTDLYGVPWFTSPTRVDVVRVGKSQGAYTSVNPLPHIVVASGDGSYSGWAGTEMLFHEASHALFNNVRVSVNSAMDALNKPPRDLWHVVLFYVAGEVTRQELAKQRTEYRPYLYATGLFDRAWPDYKVAVEQHVQHFVDRRGSADRMAAGLAAALR